MVLKIFVAVKNLPSSFQNQTLKNSANDFFGIIGRVAQFFILYRLASFTFIVFGCIKFAKVFFPEIFF